MIVQHRYVRQAATPCGLANLRYATIYYDDDGYEVYGVPRPLGGAISLLLTENRIQTIITADGICVKQCDEFESGSITIVVAAVNPEAEGRVLGRTSAQRHVTIENPYVERLDCADDVRGEVAIGYSERLSDGTSKVTWLYKVVITIVECGSTTKGESIQFSTTTLKGIVMPRMRPTRDGHNPWRISSCCASPHGWLGSVRDYDSTRKLD